MGHSIEERFIGFLPARAQVSEKGWPSSYRPFIAMDNAVLNSDIIVTPVMEAGAAIAGCFNTCDG
jgi:hypothetical protein